MQIADIEKILGKMINRPLQFDHQIFIKVKRCKFYAGDQKSSVNLTEEIVRHLFIALVRPI